jgi:flagellar hook assembly protein FlgD
VIYNKKGQIVRTLLNEIKDFGTHSVTWDGKNDYNQQVSNGIYFYKMIDTDSVSKGKLLLIK